MVQASQHRLHHNTKRAITPYYSSATRGSLVVKREAQILRDFGGGGAEGRALSLPEFLGWKSELARVCVCVCETHSHSFVFTAQAGETVEARVVLGSGEGVHTCPSFAPFSWHWSKTHRHTRRTHTHRRVVLWATLGGLTWGGRSVGTHRPQQDFLVISQSLLSQVTFPFDLDFQGLGDIRHQPVNQAQAGEDDVLEREPPQSQDHQPLRPPGQVSQPHALFWK